MKIPAWTEQLLNRRMAICIATGFSSGLPLYLLINLLPAWLRTENISLKAIGLFALIQFPYTWKFLWAPFLDRYPLPLFGRRRGWMLLTQILLFMAIASLGIFTPSSELNLVIVTAILLAIASATQDIALDAYRRELLHENELGLGNSIHVNAYRLAGLIPGSLSLILADHVSWASVFLITSLFMLPGVLVTLLITEPVIPEKLPTTLSQAVIEPFKEFIQREGVKQALWILGFIFLYKLGDSLCTALATPFYLDMGFSKSEIGLVAKQAGLWPAVAGGLLGGLWMVKLGINRALWIFGMVQWASILGFAWLSSHVHQGAATPADLFSLAGVIGLEAFGVGVGTAAFVAFIARTTNPAYTATQFALFTSLAAVPRTFVNASAGWVVEQIGWTHFFYLCALLGIPGMILLIYVAPWQKTNSRQPNGYPS